MQAMHNYEISDENQVDDSGPVHDWGQCEACGQPAAGMYRLAGLMIALCHGHAEELAGGGL